MYTRLIHNYTGSEATIADLGITIPASGSENLFVNGAEPIDVSQSNDLFTLLGQGVANFQIEEGGIFYTLADGIRLCTQISGSPSKLDPSGKWEIHASPRPIGYTTYFSGAGDNGGLGNGNKMLFNMAANDESKSVDLTYSEEVHIKDGYIVVEGAPLGSTMDVEVVHPTDGIVATFCKNVLLLGDARVPLDTEDSAPVPPGLIVRVTINNSSGTGDEDPAAAFKVVGRIEMYRSTVV